MEENNRMSIYTVPKQEIKKSIEFNLKADGNEIGVILKQYENKSYLNYYNKNENFSKDDVVEILIQEFNKKYDKIIELIKDWKDYYKDINNTPDWTITLNDGENVKIHFGKGAYPENWNKFIDVISECEILYNEYKSKHSSGNKVRKVDIQLKFKKDGIKVDTKMYGITENYKIQVSQYSNINVTFNKINPSTIDILIKDETPNIINAEENIIMRDTEIVMVDSPSNIDGLDCIEIIQIYEEEE